MRLTSLKSIGCVLNQRVAARRIATTALSLVGVAAPLNADVFNALSFADAPRAEIPRRALETSRLPAPPVAESPDVPRELDRLEFQFREAQKLGSDRLDELTPLVRELLENVRSLEMKTLSDESAERAASLGARLEEFQRLLVENADFFETLAQLDAASLNADETRRFFASFLSQNGDASTLNPDFNETSERLKDEGASSTVATFREELERAAASFDALRTLEVWNGFVEENGEALERFYVAPEIAETALDFISQNVDKQGLPREFKVFAQRADEWRFSARNRVAVQRKILLALEEELATKYWTFAAAPDKIYYLKRPPRPGRNAFVSDAQGTLGVVEIPATAPETLSDVSTQHLFLQELANEARSIPESLRSEDAARWYAAWSDFLSRLQTTDALDPLVRFRLLRSATSTLADADFYFARRLAPALRMLTVPRLESADVFQTESVETQELRRLAKTRIDFLPKDRLVVDKTTAQLDAQTPKFSFVYRRVGWLDRDFSGAWRRRGPETLSLPVGDLYVLLPATDDATNDVATVYGDASVSEKSPASFRWLKIGFSDGRRTTLEFAAPDVCRGAIVLCRSRVDSSAPPVARQGELERILRR